MIISPTSPCGTSLPASSTMRISTPALGLPQERSLLRAASWSSGFKLRAAAGRFRQAVNLHKIAFELGRRLHQQFFGNRRSAVNHLPHAGDINVAISGCCMTNKITAGTMNSKLTFSSSIKRKISAGSTSGNTVTLQPFIKPDKTDIDTGNMK